jgi:HlyD family secretion protein
VVVSAEVPVGIIEEVYPGAEVGQLVEEGQPLLKLEDDIPQMKLEHAQASKLLAQAALDQAEAGRHRASRALQAAETNLQAATEQHNYVVGLLKINTDTRVRDQLKIAEKALEGANQGVEAAKAGMSEAEAGEKTARAKVQEAEVGVRVAERTVKAMTIKAPIAGFILEKKVAAKGQLVSAQATPVLFVIVPDRHQLEVQAMIGEAEIVKVRVGMEATFKVDAHPDDNAIFRGRVTRIAETPTTASIRLDQGQAASLLQGPVLYAVTIDVTPPSKDGESRPLKVGMTASVELMIPRVEKAVLRVPTAALSYRPEQLDSQQQQLIEERAPKGLRPLWVWTEGENAQLIFVKTGASDGTRTEVVQVIEGTLKEGMEVIVEGPPPVEKGGLFEAKTPIRI